MLARPERGGVHAKMASGALAVAVVHPPRRALEPAVTPRTVPPAAEITIGEAHVPAGGMVVLVVELVLVVLFAIVSPSKTAPVSSIAWTVSTLPPTSRARTKP